MSQIKLYGFILCPYVHRVRFALESLNIKYDYTEIDLFKNKQRDEAYLAINPFGKVPSIGFNNEIIYESLPLLEFIENQFGGVFPEDNVRKAQQRIWAAYFDQNFITKMWAIFALIKTKDQEAIKKLALELAEILRFFTKNSKLSERVKLNGNTFFEGQNLTYVDFAVIPHFKFLELIYGLIFKTPFFEQIDNDELIQNFQTYYKNVTSSEAYKKITYNLFNNLPAQGENHILDTLAFTHETYNFETLFQTYIQKKME